MRTIGFSDYARTERVKNSKFILKHVFQYSLSPNLKPRPKYYYSVARQKMITLCIEVLVCIFFFFFFFRVDIYHQSNFIFALFVRVQFPIRHGSAHEVYIIQVHYDCTGTHYVFDILSRQEKKNSDTNVFYNDKRLTHNIILFLCIISITNAYTTIAAGCRKLDIFK